MYHVLLLSIVYLCIPIVYLYMVGEGYSVLKDLQRLVLGSCSVLKIPRQHNSNDGYPKCVIVLEEATLKA